MDTTGASTASQIVVKLGTNNALPTSTVLTIDGQVGAGSVDLPILYSMDLIKN